MDFDWDEDKRAGNIAKHAVDFVAAIPVFDDPNAIEAYDEEHSDDEDRFRIIGKARPGILFVVYTERDNGNTIHLISVRHALTREIAKYYSMIQEHYLWLPKNTPKTK